MVFSILSYALLSLAIFQLSLGFLFEKKDVCYKNIGCYSNAHPFTNALGDLPDSPEKIKITYHLHTRENHVLATILDQKNVENVAESNFDAEKETKFIIHGYMSSYNDTVFQNLTAALLKKGDFNVIGVDWKEGAHKMYQKAVANTRVVGAVTAKFIQALHDKFLLSYDNVHLIGHSLGAQTAGYCGRRIPQIDRITGLDPAGPLYTGTDASVRLDSTDAQFVDVIHTDADPLRDMGFGTPDAVGDMDFFPNGGHHQPGCPPPVKSGLEDVVTFDFNRAFDEVGCSHTRSIQLLTASLLDEGCPFKAYPCQSWKDYKQGKCSYCGRVYPRGDPGSEAVLLRCSEQAMFCW